MQGPEKPCTIPAGLCLTGLFECLDGNDCGCESTTDTPSFVAGKVKEFCELNAGTIDTTALVYPDECPVEQQQYLALWWRHMVNAYVSLYERTCRRFHGCCLALPICFSPSMCCKCDCDCVCDPCAEPECYSIENIDDCLEGAQTAHMVTYPADGSAPVVDVVNLPGIQPDLTARWRLTDDGRICRLKTGGTYPVWPPQDMTVPPGAPGTSMLKIGYCKTLDPEFVFAVYELAQQFAVGCSPKSKCSIGNASSVSDDGYTINYPNTGTPNTAVALRWRQLGFTDNDTIDQALIRWQCKDDEGSGYCFGGVRRRADVKVRDRFWCACG